MTSEMTQDSAPRAPVATLREANIARQAEWLKGTPVTLSFRGNELAGEVGEACNVIKKLERARLGLPGSTSTREDLAKELADVVICADLIAMQEGIDLVQAIADTFNAKSDAVGMVTRLRSPPKPTRVSVQLPAEWEEMEFGVFKPCQIINREVGLTEYLFEDASYFSRAVGTSGLHEVDWLIAMDDGRLVGMQFWTLHPKLAERAAVEPTIA